MNNRTIASELASDVQQALLNAANEIEGSEEALDAVVDEKRDLIGTLAHTESNLRAAYDMIARRKTK